MKRKSIIEQLRHAFYEGIARTHEHQLGETWKIKEKLFDEYLKKIGRKAKKP